MTTTTNDQIATDVNDSQGLRERVRGQVRGAIDQLFGRVRSTLDIPTRGELSELLDRIEKLDVKLTALDQAKLPAPAAKAVTKAKKPATANKTARRDRIETAAKKR